MIKNNIFSIFMALTLPIAMVSGLFTAPWTAGILAGMSCYYFYSTDLKTNSFLAAVTPSKIEIIILLYVVSSCLWSVEKKTSMGLSLQLFTIILLARFILNQSYFFSFNRKIIITGLLAAILVFYIERFAYGYISNFLRTLTYRPKTYDLSWLDRGCSLLSITAWPVLSMLIEEGKKKFAAGIYVLVLVTLSCSDNGSGLLGFIIATIGYILLVMSGMRLSWLIKFSVIFYVIVMPVASKLENPRVIAQEYGDILPISYTHRLLVWNFVASKGLESPIIGHGIGTSKFVPVKEEDHFLYMNKKLSPLPLHPHNNVLQIFLELGGAGLVLFACYIWHILSKIHNISVQNKDILWGASAYATFINYFFIGMVSFGIWQSWWMLSILFVLILQKRHQL